MADTLEYVVKTQMELNSSYMSFIKEGGLFIPTSESFQLGDNVVLDLQLPGHPESRKVEGKVIWITPANSPYQIYPGIGIQFTGDQAKTTHDLIKSNIDNTQDVGCYAYGIGYSPNV